MPETIAMTPSHPTLGQLTWEVIELGDSILYAPPQGDGILKEFVQEGCEFGALPSIDLQRLYEGNPFSRPRVRDFKGLALRSQEFTGSETAKASGLAWVRANLVAQVAASQYLGLLEGRRSSIKILMPEYLGLIARGSTVYQMMTRIDPSYTNISNGDHGYSEKSLFVRDDLEVCLSMYFAEIGLDDGLRLLSIDGCDCNNFFSPDLSEAYMIDVSRVDRDLACAEKLNLAIDGA